MPGIFSSLREKLVSWERGTPSTIHCLLIPVDENPQKTKPHVPRTGKWGLAFVFYGAFVSPPPRSQRGLRAKICKPMIRKWASESKGFKGIRGMRGIMEMWKIGRMEEWKNQRTE